MASCWLLDLRSKELILPFMSCHFNMTFGPKKQSSYHRSSFAILTWLLDLKSKELIPPFVFCYFKYKCIVIYIHVFHVELTLSNTNNSLQLWVVRLLVLYLLRSWAHVTRYPVNKPDTSSVVIISLFFNKSRWNRIRILLFCLLYRYVMVKSAIFL